MPLRPFTAGAYEHSGEVLPLPVHDPVVYGLREDLLGPIILGHPGKTAVSVSSLNVECIEVIAVKTETAKGILCVFGDQSEHWVPKSVTTRPRKCSTWSTVKVH
jgi:hypothetical protein